MSYLLFDLLAVALPALLLLRSHHGSVRGAARRALLGPVLLLAAVAVVWTGPWDDHLVRTSVWTYDATGVLGRIGAVPVEEYAFVCLQVLLVGAWALRTGALIPTSSSVLTTVLTPPRTRHGHPAVRHRGALGWAVVALVGAALVLAGGHLRYLGLLLVWAAPPLALQHLVAGDVLAARRAPRLRTALPVTAWLCVADRLALAHGTWTITPGSATGLSVAGLPVEELLFFALTCLLVTDGLLLAADPAVRHRVAMLVRRVAPRRPAAPARALPAGRLAATAAARPR